MSDTETRITRLEEDLSRALLLLQTLAELCVAKGMVTPAEIKDLAAKLDQLDGVRDGKLDPTIFWPTEGQAKLKER